MQYQNTYQENVSKQQIFKYITMRLSKHIKQIDSKSLWEGDGRNFFSSYFVQQPNLRELHQLKLHPYKESMSNVYANEGFSNKIFLVTFLQ